MKILLLLSFFLSINANSQSISIFDIDNSDYPNMKAKFYAFDKDGNYQTPSLSELTLSDNHNLREITNINCYSKQPITKLSTVLAVDVTSSMLINYSGIKSIDIAKTGVMSWINTIDSNSECAVTAFCEYNFISKDFTNDKTKLTKFLNTLSIQGGKTNFEIAMLNKPTGGLLISKNSKFKKIIILFSSRFSNSFTNVQSIIDEANSQNCTIYCLSIGDFANQNMKDIATQTGGGYFDNISSEEEAKHICSIIYATTQKLEPCTIEWVAKDTCNISSIYTKLTWKSVSSESKYLVPQSKIHSLRVYPNQINFGAKLPHIEYDTTITLTSENFDSKVISINKKHGTGEFSIVNTIFPLFIPKNTSKTVTLRFTPLDSSINYLSFEIETDKCQAFLSAIGGDPKIGSKINSLKLIKPNGGEKFIIGIDTLITWDGVSPNDTMTLDYSSDNGKNWEIITEKASGLSYKWQNMPFVVSDSCLVKVRQSISSEIEWSKIYEEGSLHRGDKPKSIQKTKDGGYILSGDLWLSVQDYKGQGHDDCDYYIVKIDSVGNEEWSKRYGGSDVEKLYSIQTTSDGGYIVAGTTNSNNGDVSGYHGDFGSSYYDFWILKIDAYGNIEWSKCYGGSEMELTCSIQTTSDGGYILAGDTFSNDGDIGENNGGGDLWILKIDSTGNKIWSKCFGGSYWEKPSSIQSTSDGGYIVAVTTISNDGDVSGNHGNSDIWILKIDSLGNKIWSKCFGGSDEDYQGSIQITIDGGCVVAGTTISNDGDVSRNHGNSDIWILKIDSLGNKIWSKCFGGSSDDYAKSLQTTIDGGYVVTGTTDSNDGDINDVQIPSKTWVLKIDRTANMKWSNYYEKKVYPLTTTPNDKHIFASADNVGELWVGKLNSDETDIFKADTSNNVFSIVIPEIETHDIDMGKVFVGNYKDSLITDFIKNTGVYKCKVDKIIFYFDYFCFQQVKNFIPNIIESGESQAIALHFEPNQVGTFSDTILIFTASKVYKCRIFGEGLQKNAQINTKFIDFDYVKVGLDKESFTRLFTNTGSTSISITGIEFSGPNKDDFTFSFGIEDSTFVILPKNSVDMQLKFKPSDSGRTSSLLKFYYDGVDSPAVVQLFGIGVKNEETSIVYGNIKTSKYSIKPNPAREEIEIEYSNTKDGVTTLSIIDAMGQVAKEFQLGKSQNGRVIINLKGLSQGFYNCQFRTDSYFESHKLLIVK